MNHTNDWLNNKLIRVWVFNNPSSLLTEYWSCHSGRCEDHIWFKIYEIKNTLNFLVVYDNFRRMVRFLKGKHIKDINVLPFPMQQICYETLFGLREKGTIVPSFTYLQSEFDFIITETKY
jgi:hypothetical protein